MQQPGRLSSLITRGKDDLCSLVKYPSKSRERHLQKISLDERYVRPKCLWCYFSFFAVEQWKPTKKNVISWCSFSHFSFWFYASKGMKNNFTFFLQNPQDFTCIWPWFLREYNWVCKILKGYFFVRLNAYESAANTQKTWELSMHTKVAWVRKTKVALNSPVLVFTLQ